MRIAIYGSGGVGCYVGGRLQAGGHEVAFIARGANLAGLRANGLSIQSAQGDLRLASVNATDDPAQVGPVDVVVLCVKLYDLEDAAAKIKPLLGPHTMVVPIQNGIDSADRLQAVLGVEHVVKGLVFVVSHLAGPGRVQHRSEFCKLIFAEVNGSASPRCTQFAAALVACGIEGRVSENIEADLWRKFTRLAPFSAVACLARANLGEILDNAALFSLLADAVAEVVAVAGARGVPMASDTVTVLLDEVKSYPREARPSMLVDLLAGRRLELDSLSGAVVRMGKAAGVPTPVHDVAWRALGVHVGGHAENTRARA